MLKSVRTDYPCSQLNVCSFWNTAR